MVFLNQIKKAWEWIVEDYNDMWWDDKLKLKILVAALLVTVLGFTYLNYLE